MSGVRAIPASEPPRSVPALPAGRHAPSAGPVPRPATDQISLGGIGGGVAAGVRGAVAPAPPTPTATISGPVPATPPPAPRPAIPSGVWAQATGGSTGSAIGTGETSPGAAQAAATPPPAPGSDTRTLRAQAAARDASAAPEGRTMQEHATREALLAVAAYRAQSPSGITHRLRINA